MAKWGEGDPRWIVEERADGTNVNNWHWSEKNATPWSMDRLKELLVNLTIEEGPVKIILSDFKKCEGEATANNRKAKLIFLFEWEIVIPYVARVAGSELEYKGSIEIPNLSDENEADEVDVIITLDSKGPHEQQVRHVLDKKADKIIHEQLGIYIRELKEEFSKGLQLPTDKKPQVVTKGKTITNVDKQAFHNKVVKTDNSSSSGTPVVETKSFSFHEEFKVQPHRLFEVFQDKNLVQAWANGSVDWNFKEGGIFALFGGNVTGTFTQIEPSKRILMAWRLKGYPEGHHADIEFLMKDQRDSTKIEINAARVPSSKAEETQQGLDRYYLQSIARTFGFSSRF